jgi:hypothetical protein
VRIRILVASVVGLCACASHAESGIASRADDLGGEEVHAPKQNACEKYRSPQTTYQQCQGFRATAREYLQHLNTGDMICLENGFGDEIGPNCKARGAVVDADSHGFLIQVRDPALDSKWHADQGQRIYFENGALVDIYLRDRGYE